MRLSLTTNYKYESQKISQNRNPHPHFTIINDQLSRDTPLLVLTPSPSRRSLPISAYFSLSLLITSMSVYIIPHTLVRSQRFPSEAVGGLEAELIVCAVPNDELVLHQNLPENVWTRPRVKRLDGNANKSIPFIQ